MAPWLLLETNSCSDSPLINFFSWTTTQPIYLWAWKNPHECSNKGVLMVAWRSYLSMLSNVIDQAEAVYFKSVTVGWDNRKEDLKFLEIHGFRYLPKTKQVCEFFKIKELGKPKNILGVRLEFVKNGSPCGMCQRIWKAQNHVSRSTTEAEFVCFAWVNHISWISARCYPICLQSWHKDLQLQEYPNFCDYSSTGKIDNSIKSIARTKTLTLLISALNNVTNHFFLLNSIYCTAGWATDVKAICSHPYLKRQVNCIH
jgi:hypothetical protein